MSVANDIRAGGAYIELLLKDADFNKRLDAAGNNLKSWGVRLAKVGAAIAAVGTAITAPLTELTREFAAAGAELFNMNKRTNESVEALNFLKFAAEETGTSLDVIQRAMFAVQKKGKDFDTVALQIAGIQDPARQSRRAIEEFGKKSGPFLLPLLKDLPALRAEFDRLGLAKGMSKEDVGVAKELDAAFHSLTAVIKSVRNVIGAALAPVVKDMTEWVTDLIVKCRDWLDNNRALIVSAFNFGRVLVAVGTAIASVGAVLYIAGTFLSGFAGLFALAGTAVTAMLSPVGLLVAGLGALAYWFGTTTNSGRAMVNELKSLFVDLKATAIDAFNGIVDALAAGDFILAAKILWAGLKIEWAQGSIFLREKWMEFKDEFYATTLAIKDAAIQAWGEFTTKIIEFFDVVKRKVFEVYEYIKDVPKMAFTFDKSGNAIIRMERQHRINQQMDREGQADVAGAGSTKPARTSADAIADEASKARTRKLNEDLAAARADLAALSKQAAIERNARGLRGKGPDTPFIPDSGDIKGHISGTFFAAAAALAGKGGNEGPTRDQQREANGLLQQQLKAATDMRIAWMKLGLRS